MSKAHNLNRLAYFAAVVETGSFTNAADRLGVTKAVVSSQVSQLEQELRTTLLVRNTRKVSTTEAGRLFYTRCVSILNEAEEAFSELSQLSEQPVGTLRMTAPYDYGTEIVAPLVAAFRSQHPDCQVELHLGDDHSDLLAGDLDLAIRVGWLRDSTLLARKLGGFRQLLIGAGANSGQFNAIQHPNDLAASPFVANKALSDPLQWRFENAFGETVSVKLQSDLSIDSAPAIMAAVREGAGLAILPDYLVRDHLTSGVLTQVLPEWHLPEGGIFIVLPASKFRAAKVSVFTEMLRQAEKIRNSG
ncbi:DNA-binding transcriptional LysR family regulator [Primorskyibacter sedentarius]|uniref:DNA-binding transcriptional LysR family regulator n=1 Tax=Primorskyibacter sedentarius TaxID=745311 RepID=A0A4V2UL29_9RHOB|nr:LysR family transcriptional regulator [Primorskyibacter sedentarius]TCS48361.1 DNA-binding transcriptional LysR family regulator [Primorskyibacter sedentarius]